MKIKKSWKPMISIVGILVIMMTAASVAAEDPIIRETQAPEDMGMIDTIDETEGNAEPLLIATGDDIAEEGETNELPDYQNYTGDMLISPNPTTTSEATLPLSLPVLGIIGVVVIIGLAGSGILIRRKQKK
jgi:hypothetical protein